MLFQSERNPLVERPDPVSWKLPDARHDEAGTRGELIVMPLDLGHDLPVRRPDSREGHDRVAATLLENPILRDIYSRFLPTFIVRTLCRSVPGQKMEEGTDSYRPWKSRPFPNVSLLLTGSGEAADATMSAQTTHLSENTDGIPTRRPPVCLPQRREKRLRQYRPRHYSCARLVMEAPLRGPSW